MLSVSIIIPAKNEEGNIKRLLQDIRDALLPYKPELKYEVVVVDDSTDKTAAIARHMGARVIKGRGLGLAQAVLDGIDQTISDCIIVMDADGQHSPLILPKVVEQLKFHDLVVMTKHTKEASAEMSWWRKLQSNLAVWLTGVLIPVPVSDPMTGFFGIRRKCLDGIPRGEYIKVDHEKIKKKAEDIEASLPENWRELDEATQIEWYLQNGYATKLMGLEAIGFKIGLELFAKAKWVSHAEVPMEFLKREHGMSKGTRHALQKHLWHLFKNSLNYDVELPKGSEEYLAFYEGTEYQKKWKQAIAYLLRDITQDIGSKRILDVGCGSSPNLNYMVADEKIGIDINEKALEYMWLHSDGKSEFYPGSVLSIPLPDSSFDTVCCIEVLEHLYANEIDNALSEIARVLKPEGHAILATPNYGNIMWHVVEHAQQIIQKGAWTSDHHTKLSRSKLGELCQSHELKEVRYDSVMHNMDMVITYEKIGG